MCQTFIHADKHATGTATRENESQHMKLIEVKVKLGKQKKEERG
jgi:hypothetical protein